MSPGSFGEMVAAWVVIPVLLMVLAAGLGELVARLSRRPLGSMTLPAGFAASVLAVTVLLQTGMTGRAASIVLATASLPGLVLLVRRSGRPSTDALFLAGAGFAVYALAMLPLVTSGRVAVLGYVLNNDSAVHLSAIELIFEGGRAPTGLPPSSYASVTSLIGSGYPPGGYAWPMLGSLTSIDAFATWTPILALYSVLLALVVHAVLTAVGVATRWAAALAAIVASGYLPYSFFAQAGLKETATALCILGAVVLLLGPAAGRGQGSSSATSMLRQRALPAGIMAGAAVGIFGVGAGAWLTPVGLAGLLAVAWQARRRALPRLRTLIVAAVVIAGTVVISIPFVERNIDFINASDETLRNPAQAGNLLGAIPWHQSLNIWFAQDYRVQPPDWSKLSGLGWRFALIFAIVGLIWALYRRRTVLLVAIAAAAVGSYIVTERYSIYLDAKALVILAPAQGLLTAAGIWAAGRRYLAIRSGLVAVFALGVLLSALLVHSGVWLTPDERFAELRSINERYAGRGPMLVNEREQYAMYLLRDVAPWESWGTYQPERGFAVGELFPETLPHTPDFDDYRTDFVQQFPFLLERLRPGGSRPPSNYRPLETGQNYRIWERTRARPPAVHLGLGNKVVEGADRIDCTKPEVADLLRTARTERRSLLLAPPPPPIAEVTRARDWAGYQGSPVPPPVGMITRRRGGSRRVVELPRGRYSAWIQGSFGPGAILFVDDRKIGRVQDDLGLPDAWQRFGEVTVTKPRTTVVQIGGIERRWRPGSRHVDINGSTVFVPMRPRAEPRPVPPSRLSSICGERADWIELLT